MMNRMMKYGLSIDTLHNILAINSYIRTGRFYDSNTINIYTGELAYIDAWCCTVHSMQGVTLKSDLYLYDFIRLINNTKWDDGEKKRLLYIIYSRVHAFNMVKVIL